MKRRTTITRRAARIRGGPGLALAACAGLVLAGCGGGEPSNGGADAEPEGSGELSAVELEQGIGPVRDLELGPVDPGLAATGEAAFQAKCSSCHRLDTRLVAPVLGDVLSRRRPEFVMNMMLNPEEMVERHPVAQELMTEYLTPMPRMVADREEARAVLEYLRSVQTEPAGGS